MKRMVGKNTLVSIDLPAQPARSAAIRLDATCAQAADLARAALVAVVGEACVGEHLQAVGIAERLVEHRFAAFQPGYVAWYWSVTTARAPRGKQVTVCDVALLPAEQALLAPAWVPWSRRLRPGDVGVGDLLPAAADDERLAPSFLLPEDVPLSDDNLPNPDEQVGKIPGVGRPRVMSVLGREQAAQRWYDSDAGPEAQLAKATRERCGTCGFYVQLSGSLGAAFGACANLYAPDDGRIVSADHGCGAHSEAVAV
ncbi:MAG: DUF3027 domain-containing protein [Mycobacteriales bacterium]